MPLPFPAASPVIPLLDLAGPDPLGDYRAGLERLAALPGVRHIVPGHGSVGDAAGFRRRVAADFAYLDRLARGDDSDDPQARPGLAPRAAQPVAGFRASAPVSVAPSPGQPAAARSSRAACV